MPVIPALGVPQLPVDRVLDAPSTLTIMLCLTYLLFLLVIVLLVRHQRQTGRIRLPDR